MSWNLVSLPVIRLGAQHYQLKSQVVGHGTARSDGSSEQ